jgi:Xaa-Pro aminopeptidase
VEVVVTPDLKARTAARRQAYLKRLGNGAALLPGTHNVVRSADSDFPFRQDSDFYYLTGLEEADAVCVLRPDAAEPFVLFVLPRDRDQEIWTGRRVGAEGAKEFYGADAAFPISEMDTRLPDLLRDVDTLHYALGHDAAMDQRVLRIAGEQRKIRPRRGHGIVRFEDPSVVLHEMRLLKDDYELGRMRAAAAITCEAHRLLMRETRPGLQEYELQAMLEYQFRSRGASGPAYGSIVGGGANATVLHYVTNRDRLQDGQLVLVDAGCELDCYASDVTRTFPVGASFTPEQAAVYQVVLDAQLQAIATVRPGATFIAAHDIAVRVLCEGLVDLGLVEGPVDRAIESSDYRKYYMHRTGHWLGLDVHDVGLYESGGESRRLEPGMVLTVEPGIYIAADDPTAPAAFRGIGVRIEDDVLVTSGGAEILTAAVPKAIAEIEALRAVPATAS